MHYVCVKKEQHKDTNDKFRQNKSCVVQRERNAPMYAIHRQKMQAINKQESLRHATMWSRVVMIQENLYHDYRSISRHYN